MRVLLLVSLVCIAVSVAVFAPLSAAAFSAVITTRPGVATAPLKVPFDTAAVLGGKCVNHNVKVTVTASNAQKTAVQFDRVQLYGKDGSLMGNNVASKTDILSATPYSFIFTNFGVLGSLLDKVAGVQLVFADAGGDDSTGKVTVSAVLVSDECQSGRACVLIPDAIVQTKPNPPPNIESAQKTVLIRPVSAGSGSATTAGPRGGGTFTDGGGGGLVWDIPGNAATLNGIYTTAFWIIGITTSNTLQVRNFGFSIPSTATINGIEFNITLKADGGEVTDNSVKFVKAGTAVGNDLKRTGVSWPISDTAITFGGPTQLAGVSWTPADINNINFGIDISTLDNSASKNAYIDYISAKVYYTTASASVYDTVRDFPRQIMNTFFCAILRQKCE